MRTIMAMGEPEDSGEPKTLEEAYVMYKPKRIKLMQDSYNLLSNTPKNLVLRFSEDMKAVVENA